MSEAELLIDAGVRIIPIGVKTSVTDEISSIADMQGLQLMEIDSIDNLKTMSDQVLEAVHDGRLYKYILCAVENLKEFQVCREIFKYLQL